MKPLLVVTLALTFIGVAANAQEPPKLETTVEKFSYSMGYRSGRELLQQGLSNLDSEALAAGMRDAMAGQSFPYSQEQLTEIMTAYRQILKEAQETAAAANAEEGKKFLAENENADGVQTLPGGVQYKVGTEGSGEMPEENDSVRVHYSGKLLDGTEFDSSYKRGEPTELNLQSVIPGWRAALLAMPTGSKWTVWIPPELAYGSGGAGGLIGPNETLSFEIELIEVVPTAQ